MSDIWRRFFNSIAGPIKTIEHKVTKCEICGRPHAGPVCPSCGYGGDENIALQEFAKSFNKGNNLNVVHCYLCGHTERLPERLAEMRLEQGCSVCGSGELLDVISMSDWQEMETENRQWSEPSSLDKFFISIQGNTRGRVLRRVR